jgi:hypothetical protein
MQILQRKKKENRNLNNYELGPEVSLYITDIGPNKMKVIALLKKV